MSPACRTLSPSERKSPSRSNPGTITATRVHGEARTIFAFDLETTGLDPHKGAKIFAWAICSMDGGTEVFRDEGWREALIEFLSRPVVLVAHNFHFELAMLSAEGFDLSRVEWHDTMIFSQIFDNLQPSHALDYQAYKWGRYPMEADEAVARAAKIYGTYDKIPRRLMDPYQRADVERCALLYLTFRPLIEKDPRMWADYLNEIELVKVTVKMEARGVMLCRPEAEKLVARLAQDVKDVEKAVFESRGEFINLNSGQQVARLLFDEMGLPVLKNTKAGSRATDKDALEALRPEAEKIGGKTVEIFDLILRQRSATKGIAMISSYIKAAGTSGIIHPHINTNRAQTGRESGENPNLQNISKDAALKTKFPVPARRCFRSRPGCVFFLVDYAGIEMRLIVEITREPELVLLIKKNGDPHALAASLFYAGIWDDEVRLQAFTKEADPIKARKILRTASKNAQFALAYGARLPKIASVLMLSEDEAIPGFRKYSQRFPRIASFTDDQKRQVRNRGYVVTSFGRRLYVPADKPYSGSNYVIQGTAAGILKRAQVRVDRLLDDAAIDARILLPIHDELIVEAPRAALAQAGTLLPAIAREMTTFDEIDVPLDVEWKMTTYTWDKAKGFNYEN